ncbi:MAG: hypothetical protein ABS79_00295 [Planctomycetes bacterium SCN 63-9]|nr:MAG: hypothetical protein ABS79_00295 [Planctomycetes bacterium SCN 63-9]
MIEKVICGFQTGADIAGAEAARLAGLATGGYMPGRFMTEAGPRPEYARLYGAVVIDLPGRNLAEQYKERTRLNVREADVTILFGDPTSRGSLATYRAYREIKEAATLGFPDPGISYCRPGWIQVPDHGPRSWPTAADAAAMLAAMPHRIVNIAGNRESAAPGIGEWVRTYLVEVFRLLREIRDGAEDSGCPGTGTGWPPRSVIPTSRQWRRPSWTPMSAPAASWSTWTMTNKG